MLKNLIFNNVDFRFESDFRLNNLKGVLSQKYYCQIGGFKQIKFN